MISDYKKEVVFIPQALAKNVDYIIIHGFEILTRINIISDIQVTRIDAN